MYDTYPPSAQKIIGQRFELAREQITELKDRSTQLNESMKAKPEKISISAQATNFGQISEQILPAFLTFPYKQEECRILLKPVDYIVFVGLSQRARVDNIKFVELKTGAGRLNKNQRQIRDRVTEGKIAHRIIGQ
jgi:predicted Holliday junction resolvase-like endonuclease